MHEETSLLPEITESLLHIEQEHKIRVLMELYLLRTLLPETLSDTVSYLLEQKTVADEKAMIVPVVHLNKYIRTTLDSCANKVHLFPKHRADTELLNEFFRATVYRQV